MPNQMVAVEIIEPNYQAIVSECGSAFNDTSGKSDPMGYLKDWVAKNGSGYFIRDPQEDAPSAMDCLLLVTEDFHKMYRLLPMILDDDGLPYDPIFQRIKRR